MFRILIFLSIFTTLKFDHINAQVRTDIVLIKPIYKKDTKQIEELGLFVEIKNNTDQYLFFWYIFPSFPNVQVKQGRKYIDRKGWSLVNIYDHNNCPINFEDSSQFFSFKNFNNSKGYHTYDSLIQQCKIYKVDTLNIRYSISLELFGYFSNILFLKPHSTCRYYVSLPGINLPGKYRVFYSSGKSNKNFKDFSEEAKKHNIVIPQKIDGFERFQGVLSSDTLYFKIKGFRWPRIKLRRDDYIM
jgi:hypothetical protein